VFQIMDESFGLSITIIFRSVDHACRGGLHLHTLQTLTFVRKYTHRNTCKRTGIEDNTYRMWRLISRINLNTYATCRKRKVSFLLFLFFTVVVIFYKLLNHRPRVYEEFFFIILACHITITRHSTAVPIMRRTIRTLYVYENL
jgi:hypothetical protein